MTGKAEATAEWERQRKEFDKRRSALHDMEAAAIAMEARRAELAKREAKLKEEQERFSAVTTTIIHDMEKLETKGIKEFEDYRKSLIAVSRGLGKPPMPIMPLEVAVKRMEAAKVDQRTLAPVEKLVAAASAWHKQWAAMNHAVQEIMKEWTRMDELAQSIAADMQKIDTGGVKELEDYRKALIGMKAGTHRPLPIAPVKAAVHRLDEAGADSLRKLAGETMGD